MAHDRQIMNSLLQDPLTLTLTVIGQIMNRFLQDLSNVDSVVPNAILDQCTKTLSIITQLSLIFGFAPWVLFTLPVLTVPFILIYMRVRVAARDARRIEAVAHSPLYSHFSDSMTGSGDN